MVWEVLFMKENSMPTENKETKNENTYMIEINNNIFHVISKFQGTETASKIIYDLAVKRILYDDSIKI